GAEFGDDRAVTEEGRDWTAVLADRDCDAGAMRRIREVDPRQPLGRDRDRADRGVELVALESLENRLHLRDGRKAVLAPDDFGRAPPKIDADSVDRTVRLDNPVGRHVVDGDLERRARRRLVRRCSRREKETSERRCDASADDGTPASNSKGYLITRQRQPVLAGGKASGRS